MQSSPVQPKRILVVKPDAMGDFILLSPFLRELRLSYPMAVIDLVVDSRVYPLAEYCPYVNNIVVMPKDQAAWNVAAVQRFSLPGTEYDLAILARWHLDYNGATAIMVASGATRRLGYSERCSPNKAKINSGYDQFYTEVIHDQLQRHEVERYLNLLKYLGKTTLDSSLEVWYSNADKAFAREFLTKSGVVGDFVAVNFGGSTWSKRLDLETADRLVRTLLATTELPLVLFGGPDELALAELLCAATGVVNAVGQLTPRQLCAAFDNTVLAVCTDSLVKHVAAANDVPVIELSAHAESCDPGSHFSGTEFSAWGVPSVIVKPAEPLAPCGYQGCEALQPHCTRQLSSEQLVQAISELRISMKNKCSQSVSPSSG